MTISILHNLTSGDNEDAAEDDDRRGLLASEEDVPVDEDLPYFSNRAKTSTEFANSSQKDPQNPPNENLSGHASLGISEVPKASGEESEDEEGEKVPVSYFSLYRYSSNWEKFLIFLGLTLATLTGLIPALANYSFGEFTKVMVDYASNSSRQCPPPPSNETSPFMKGVERFNLYQMYLAVFDIVFGYLFVMCLNYTAEKQVYKIRKEYFKKLMQQEVSWFDKNSKRDFSSRMVDDMLKIQDSMSEKLGIFVSSVVNCVFLTVVSFLIGWKLTLALLAFIPFLAMLSAFEAKVESNLTAKEHEAYAEAGAVAEEVFTNIRTVHAFNSQEKEIKRYDEKIMHAKKVAYKRYILTGLGNGLTWFGFLSNFAFAFWYGSVLVVNSRETGDGLYGPGNVLVILFGTLTAGFAFGSSSEKIAAISGGTGAAASIFPLLDRESEINSASTDGYLPDDRPKGEIVFNDVAFSYPTRPDAKVLTKLSLRVSPGQTVALVGASGCGKSTCVQLLQRLYDSTSGKILLDGVNIKLLNIKWLRSQLGVVGQEPVLFNTTIAKNITFGLKGVSDEEIKAAAKLAYAHKFIMQLPQGYETLVGERGTSLSGGQKQRIAIARALVRNPSVLLLDEATSALDFQSESIVQAALEQASRGRSTIIVAHRLSTIRAADRIYVIDDGNVVEEGTHSELMNARGKYYKLVISQEESDALSKEKEQLQESSESQIEGEAEENTVSDPTHKRLTSRPRLISQSSIENVPTPDTKDDDDDSDEQMPGGLGLLRLWKGNMKEWPYLLGALFSSLMTGLQLPVNAYILGDFIASFTLTDDQEVLKLGRFYCYAYIGMGGAMAIFGFLERMLVGFSGENFTYRIRKMLFSTLIEQDVSFFDDQKNTVGKLTARLATDASSMHGAAGARLTGLLQAFAIVIGAGAMSFYYLPNMAAVIILFVPVIIYISFAEGKVMGSDNVVDRDSIEESCNVAVEALNNIRTVAGLCAEEQFMEMYEDCLRESHRVNLKRAHVRGIVYGIINGLPIIAYCASLWYGGYLVEQSCANIASVFKVAEALIFCSSSGGSAISYAPDYEKGKLAAARIFKLLDVRPLIDRFSSNAILGTVRGQVDLKDVNFHYHNRPKIQVLKNLSINVNAGESVALVGPSGSGKSTCASLIFRFYDPLSGSVNFDELDLRRLNLDFIRQQISLVSQEPVLFDCSIKDNIAYGDSSRELGMDEIIDAATATNMHNFISSLPAGYETRVGMLGNQMSGGQKQRIAIARAIIRRPKVLVLDEATSALDSESEIAVQAALDSAKTGRTSITIAHRLSSIANCDKIFVLKNGVIEECGTHAELIHNGGMYEIMWNAQSKQKES